MTIDDATSVSVTTRLSLAQTSGRAALYEYDLAVGDGRLALLDHGLGTRTLYVLGGAVTVVGDGRNFDLAAHDLLTLAPDEAYSVANRGTLPARWLVIVTTH